MDRQGWIIVILCVAGLIGWQIWYAPQMAPPPAETPVEAPAEPGSTAPESTRTSGDISTNPETDADTALVEAADLDPVVSEEPLAAPLPDEQLISLEDDLSIYTFTTHGGGLQNVILKNHLVMHGTNGDAHEESIIMNEFGRLPIGTLDTVAEPTTPTIYNVVSQDEATIVFEAEVAGGILIRKTYHLSTADDVASEEPVIEDESALLPELAKPGDYLLQLKVEFINTRDVAQVYPPYFLHFGEEEAIYAVDQEQYTTFQWLSDKGHKSIHTNWFTGSKVPLVGIPLRAPADVYEKTFEEIRWAAVNNQFFSILLTPKNVSAQELWATRSVAEPEGLTEEEKEHRRTIYAIHGALKMPSVQLLADSRATHEFEFYIGPKEYGRLHRLEEDQDEILNFGIFAPISVLLLNSLNFLHAIFTKIGLPYAYGLGIIGITVILKMLLWPLQTKAMVSMRNMSEQMKIVNPKMEEIRKKYKDNPQKQNEETMKLYRQYKINPIGGCLPSLIQLPIFLGFFYMLRTAVELRNADFLWVQDLSRPDTVVELLGWIPVNPLPILMTISMVFYMRIQPKTGNQMQQRMMLFMPVIFFVICYNFASALSLYWTVQNVLSVVQYFLTKDLRKPRENPDGTPADGTATVTSARTDKMKTATGRTLPSSTKGTPKPRKRR